jgi:ribosomal-protein-alanine N-acetyltransferase
MEELRTARLTLVPYSPQLIRAAMGRSGELALRLGARIPHDWPSPDYAFFLPFIAMRLNRDPSTGVWDRLIIHDQDRTLIGHLGFKGGPDATGTVDLGYAIVPAYRGQGLATEAGEAVIDWALRQGTATRMTATCHHANGPSIRVLEKLKFQRRGQRGADLLWERA